ncbi:helix-turn-helix transcriptional regulator [Streptomyces sp. PSKA30]|uniref:helix-turn-helix transcriptional regulator n=1 Tax=Streptomyces sp. PSKA30 TaxID=2874597 RepID=UPI001CD0ADB2|nr:helix-turn-helix transcriptional regulator [Streptomyces sp. PSKA30]MBZ9645037.1 helix-turn-helix transcriptional regulator [Streptomyces sp. PSKA30]
MDLGDLGVFLREQRERTHPAAVGLPAQSRRRVAGLRRNEVAQLAGLSLDYYVRLEQGRGGRPSAAALASLALALRLHEPARRELFSRAGVDLPADGPEAPVDPGVLALLDRLQGAPALVMTELTDVLVQTPLSRALLGGLTNDTQPRQPLAERWFTDSAVRDMFASADQLAVSDALVAQLKTASSGLKSSRAEQLAHHLSRRSPEFARLWAQSAPTEGCIRRVHLSHPQVGKMELRLGSVWLATGSDQRQLLLWLDPAPRSEASGQLALLGVIGLQDWEQG